LPPATRHDRWVRQHGEVSIRTPIGLEVARARFWSPLPAPVGVVELVVTLVLAVRGGAH
jgi:hypothetical protein